MRLHGLWQRLQQWIAHEHISFLYSAPTALVQQTALSAVPAEQVFTCTVQELFDLEAALPGFPPSTAEGVRTRGDLAVLATIGSQWIARVSAVLGPRPHSIIGFALPLSADAAYIEKLETLPAWRGRGVATALVVRLARELAAREVQTMYLLIDVENPASMRVFEKCGCQRTGVLISRRRFGRWHSRLILLTPPTVPDGVRRG